MAYNIAETSGNSTGSGTLGVDIWTFTADASMSVVTGDFNEVDLISGASGEAAGGYVAGPLSTTAYGTLSFDTVDGTFTFTIDRAALRASGSDQTVTFTVTGSDGAGGVDTDTVILQLLVCVAEGTRIATPRGARRVETLAPGDIVTTAAGPAPLRLRGARAVTRADMAADPDALRPVTIRAGALGRGLPERDLTVSPRHGIAVFGTAVELLYGAPGVLAPAIGLTHWPGIARGELCAITWHHLLFDRHALILTEGAPSESFYPGDWSLRGIGPAAAGTMRRAVAASASPALYGAPVLPVLKPREARLLPPPRVAVAAA